MINRQRNKKNTEDYFERIKKKKQTKKCIPFGARAILKTLKDRL